VDRPRIIAASLRCSGCASSTLIKRSLADCSRHRIEIGPHPHAPEAINARERGLRQLEAVLDQRQQMLSFRDHRYTHRLTASGDLTPFILAAGGEQLRIEIGEVARLRHRHPVIAPEVAGLAFDAALFVSFVRRAKLRS
jgi:hypothetical protein